MSIHKCTGRQCCSPVSTWCLAAAIFWHEPVDKVSPKCDLSIYQKAVQRQKVLQPSADLVAGGSNVLVRALGVGNGSQEVGEGVEEMPAAR